MVRTAVARHRAVLVICLSVALSGSLAASAFGAEPLVEPEDPDAVAAPSGDAAPSALAESWAQTELEGAAAIAGGHGTYVAVGSNLLPETAAAWSSVDGLAWEPAVVMDAPVGSSLTHVIATDDGFVALGVESGRHGSADERILAWYSPDGRTWDRATIQGPAKPGFEAVAVSLADGPAGQLALGSFIGQDLGGQRLWRSTDGRDWERAKLPRVSDPVWNTVVSYPKGYLLLGQSGRGRPSNWKSVDGMTWKRLSDTPRLFDVAVDDQGALAGIGSKYIYTSPRGLSSWDKSLKRPSSWKVGGSEAFAFIEWDGSEFVVPGYDFSGCDPATDGCLVTPLLVSVDGKAWSEAAGPDGLPGADEATWITDVASVDGSTAVLGQDMGQTVVWVVSGTSAGA